MWSLWPEINIGVRIPKEKCNTNGRAELIAAIIAI